MANECVKVLDQAQGENWALYQGDSVEVQHTLFYHFYSVCKPLYLFQQ